MRLFLILLLIVPLGSSIPLGEPLDGRVAFVSRIESVAEWNVTGPEVRLQLPRFLGRLEAPSALVRVERAPVTSLDLDPSASAAMHTEETLNVTAMSVRATRDGFALVVRSSHVLTSLTPARCIVGHASRMISGVAMLRAECQARGLVVPRLAEAWICAGTVEATFHDARGEARRTWTTGLDPRPSAPLERRCVHLTVPGGMRLESDPAATVVLESPHLLLAGDLRLPAGDGRLQWGAWVRNGSLPAMTMQGSFHLRPDETDAASITAISGRAQGVPPDLGVAAGPDPATWAWAVGLALGLLGAAWIVAALFSRTPSGDVLDNPRRRLLHEMLLQRPGSSTEELRRETGLPRSVVRHHLGVLQRSGLVRNVPDRKTSAWFCVHNAPSSNELALRRAVPSAVARSILLCLQQRPAATERELAACVGVSQQRVSKVLRWLVEAGHVSVTPTGRRVRLDGSWPLARDLSAPQPRGVAPS